MSKKLTHIEYVDRVKKINPKISVVEEYVNARTPILHICACGNLWNAIPDNVLHGKKCRKCMGIESRNRQLFTLEEYKEKLSKITPCKVECISDRYLGASIKIQHRCLRCGKELWMTPNKVLSGEGCRECSYTDIAIKETQPFEVFAERLKKANPNIRLTSEYKGIAKPLSGICDICGNSWDVKRAEQMLHGGCPFCGNICGAKKRMMSNEEFLSKINPNLFVLEEYKGPSVLLPVQCKTCGFSWSATVGSLLRPTVYGCPKCSGRIKTHEEYVQEAQLVNPTITIISKYQGSSEPIECLCNECGNKWTNNKAYHILEGVGCPICNQSHGEKRIYSCLQKYGIIFEVQKEYKELLGLGNGQLSYDFYLPSYNLLIEYQGEQHETLLEGFISEKEYEKQLEHDRRKREYAKEHDINLLEIWYYDYDNIEEILTKYLSLNSESVETVIPN